MRAFMFQAALYCEPCGQSIRDRLTAAGRAPADPADEESYDSDGFPKGPYPDGGGEADVEQHCDACRAPLDNPLTEEGQRERAERLAPQYLELDPEISGRTRSPRHSSEELGGMIEALETAYEVLPLTDEGHAVFDSMLDALRKESGKVEFANLSLWNSSIH